MIIRGNINIIIISTTIVTVIVRVTNKPEWGKTCGRLSPPEERFLLREKHRSADEGLPLKSWHKTDWEECRTQLQQHATRVSMHPIHILKTNLNN